MADPQSTIVGPVLITDRTRQLEEAEFVLDFIERSTRYREPFIPIWDEVRDNYMVVPFGQTVVDAIGALLGLRTMGVARRTSDTLSRLKDPETHQIVETLTSQALGLLLGSQDYIKAVPIGMDDPEKARLISRLLMAVFDQPGMFRTNYQMFKNAFLYGTAIVEIGWESRERMQAVQHPVLNPLTGLQDAKAIEMEPVIWRDRVLVREISLRDFYPDPSGTRIHEDMNGCAKRFRTTRWKAMELARGGVYDLAATVDALKSVQGSNKPAPQAFGDQPFPRLADFMPPDKYGLSTGFEWQGEVPFNRPGGRNRIITLLNGQWVRGKPNPFIDGSISMKEIVVNPIGGRFYGLSPAEVIRFLQDSADNFLMLFTDAGDLAVRSPMLLGTAFGGDPEKVRMRRINDVIQCRNVDAAKPIPVELGALTFAAGEMGRRMVRMREASGATNPLQAIPSSDRQTATEVSELVRLASQRVQTMVELIERDDYPWIGRTIHSRLRQFAEPDILARLAGDVFHVALDQIDVDADVRFVGSQQAGNKFQINQQYSQLVSTLGSVPLTLVAAFPDIFTRWFRDGMAIPDAELIVQKAIEMAAQQQAMEQMTGQQGPTSKRGGSPPSKMPSAQGTPAGEAEASGGAIA